MALEYQITFAFVLDLLFGDPRWLPHPVKLMGRLAVFLETPCRRLMQNEKMAGILLVFLVLSVTGLTVTSLIYGAGQIHPYLTDAISIVLLYTSLAAKDLSKHSRDVYESLVAGNLPEAREKVGRIVGRDTDNLTEAEISRAAIESVAENTSDGVTAPLFFSFICGPVGAMLYKAVNTLDSTFGYKNERYLNFGWASARLDDVANFIPARLTALIIPLAAAILNLHPIKSFRILLRDARKHPSPNSGMSEAAMAGAMGIQLGGMNVYFGRPSFRATMGDPLKPIDKKDIPVVNRLMYVTVGLFLLLGLAITSWIG